MHPNHILSFALICILSVSSSCSTTTEKASAFSQRYIQPTNGYAQMVVTRSGEQKILHISGQIGEGESLEEQMRSALAKIQDLLENEGANYQDLVKINTYIVDYDSTDLEVFRGVRKEIFGDSITPASTLVGVQALALPAWKIEIDAIAISN